MSKNKQSNIHNLKATQSINHYLKFYYKADLLSFSPNHSSTALSRLNSSKLGPCMVMAKRALSTLLLKLFLWVVFHSLKSRKTPLTVCSWCWKKHTNCSQLVQVRMRYIHFADGGHYLVSPCIYQVRGLTNDILHLFPLFQSLVCVESHVGGKGVDLLPPMTTDLLREHRGIKHPKVLD